MIDNQLINASIFHGQKSLENRISVGYDKQVFLIEDFFPSEIIDRLLKFAHNTKEWKTVDLQEHLNRKQVNWNSDSIIEEVHTVIESLTPKINEIFDDDFVNFNGISLWQDQTGYKIPNHIDNDSVQASIKIYLTTDSTNLATTFDIDNNVISAKYLINHGYIMNNRYKVRHGLENSVPQGHVRYSLYGTWQ